MSNTDDVMNNKQVKDVISELCSQMHISAEFLLEYARGELSAETCKRIEPHLKECQDCREVLDLAKKSATWEEESDLQAAASELAPPLAPKIEAKFHLVAKVNAKRSKISKGIAQLLLPEDSWNSIQLIITAIEKWRDRPSVERLETQEEVLAAAFASEAGPIAREQYELISQAVDLTNLACDLAAENSRDLSELEQVLPECIAEAIYILKDVEPEEDLRRKLMAVFMQNLFKDDSK